MFSSKYTQYYLFAFGVIAVAGFMGMHSKQPFSTSNDEYSIIKKYLLNESPLYGFNKPKLWIHSKYEVNSRQWKSFQSRTSTDLNQPYLHLTIRTIINHCSNDFNICLIDDNSFSRLIPSWDIDLASVAEPMKSHYREIGMMQLLYYYGGMIVPNSFLCMQNLKSFYDENTQSLSGKSMPFACERINNTVNQLKTQSMFLPSMYFMGAKKNDETIQELVEYLKSRNLNPHFTEEVDFNGDSSQWLNNVVRIGKMNLVDGRTIGVKATSGKPILLDNLMEEDYLDLAIQTYGIYIPADEILKRIKYKWFAMVPSEEVFNTNAIVAKYLKASIIDSSSEFTKPKETRSVISI
jgi:hypothetical protein